MRLRPATRDDAAAIAAIYAPYVTASAVSFETDEPGAAEMRLRIVAGEGRYPWLVAVDAAEGIVGYAYATGFRARPAYRFCVETSVYLDSAAQGQGVGGLLCRALIATLEAQRFAQAIAAITLPNDASVRLHERLGFTVAGVYRQVGYKQGEWHDVGLWQRALAAPADPPAEPLLLAELSQSFPPGA